MIKINKGTKPKILQDNAKQWTDEYLDALKQPAPVPSHIKYRYQNSEIKDALEKETHGKCAYCESKFKHIAFGDIEHILPKNKNACPELYVEWNNLTLACEVCNRINKKDYYEPSDPLINPIEAVSYTHLQMRYDGSSQRISSMKPPLRLCLLNTGIIYPLICIS